MHLHPLQHPGCQLSITMILLSLVYSPPLQWSSCLLCIHTIATVPCPLCTTIATILSSFVHPHHCNIPFVPCAPPLQHSPRPLCATIATILLFFVHPHQYCNNPLVFHAPTPILQQFPHPSCATIATFPLSLMHYHCNNPLVFHAPTPILQQFPCPSCATIATTISSLVYMTPLQHPGCSLSIVMVLLCLVYSHHYNSLLSLLSLVHHHCEGMVNCNGPLSSCVLTHIAVAFSLLHCHCNRYNLLQQSCLTYSHHCNSHLMHPHCNNPHMYLHTFQWPSCHSCTTIAIGMVHCNSPPVSHVFTSLQQPSHPSCAPTAMVLSYTPLHCNGLISCALPLQHRHGPL